MTFNSTPLILEQRLRDSPALIVEYEPKRLRGTRVRRLITTPPLAQLFAEGSTTSNFPHPAVDVAIGQFVVGGTIRVSRQKTRGKPDLEKIYGYDEIWALCSRKPPPGWRLVGRFISFNTLVILNVYEKGYLFSRYEAAANDTRGAWERIFGSHQPLSGSEVGDYISEPFMDIDDPFLGKS